MNADLHLESASVALSPGGGGDAGGPCPSAEEEACPVSPTAAAAPSSSSGSSGGFSYDEVFPALPEKEAVPEVTSSGGSLGQWNQRMHVKSSVITQIFHVPSEERRFRETSSQRFGDLGEQAKICADIMRDTQTTIEVSSSRDMSLTVLVTGRERNVALARAHVMRALQTQASGSIQIPKEHHRFILGKNGKNLKDLEQTTATKIHVPRTEESSDTITITGSKEGIDLARDHIQKISEEKSKQGVEKLPIERMYHPFVRGPFDNHVRGLEQEHNVRIRLGRDEDEVTITGDKENVARARDAIMAVYEDRKKHCESVGVEVKKSQHKYVHGFRGQTLQELFEQTGVWVEVPPMDSDVETIVLRGDAQNLGHALSLVYEKANSVKTATIPAKSWMHKYIIGKKGENIKKITQDHKVSPLGSMVSCFPTHHGLLFACHTVVSTSGKAGKREQTALFRPNVHVRMIGRWTFSSRNFGLIDYLNSCLYSLFIWKGICILTLQAQHFLEIEVLVGVSRSCCYRSGKINEAGGIRAINRHLKVTPTSPPWPLPCCMLPWLLIA
ncbi:unnamed protein product [Ixodes hexagonus]